MKVTDWSSKSNCTTCDCLCSDQFSLKGTSLMVITMAQMSFTKTQLGKPPLSLLDIRSYLNIRKQASRKVMESKILFQPRQVFEWTHYPIFQDSQLILNCLVKSQTGLPLLIQKIRSITWSSQITGSKQNRGMTYWHHTKRSSYWQKTWQLQKPYMGSKVFLSISMKQKSIQHIIPTETGRADLRSNPIF